MSNEIIVKSMSEALAADKHANGYKAKQYREISDEHKGKQIAQSIKDKANALKQSLSMPKVDLSKTELVEERTFAYLEACEVAQCFPSVMGLSGAMGVSRQYLNQWLLSHPGHATTDFVHRVKDVMADVLTNASLYNTANAVAVIFTLKNHFEHADRVEVCPVVQNQFDNEDFNPEEIRRRYLIDDKRN